MISIVGMPARIRARWSSLTSRPISRTERVDAAGLGDAPDLADQLRSRSHAVGLLLDPEVAAADHVENDPGRVAHLVRLPLTMLGVDPRELLRAEEVFAHARIIAEDQLLAVEQDQVDAPLRVQVREVIGDFHEERDTRGSVVGTHEREIMAIRVNFLVGVRPGIVVSADHDPLETIGFP